MNRQELLLQKQFGCKIKMNFLLLDKLRKAGLIIGTILKLSQKKQKVLKERKVTLVTSLKIL